MNLAQLQSSVTGSKTRPEKEFCLMPPEESCTIEEESEKLDLTASSKGIEQARIFEDF